MTLSRHTFTAIAGGLPAIGGLVLTLGLAHPAPAHSAHHPAPAHRAQR
jgi:hypothetical protein